MNKKQRVLTELFELCVGRQDFTFGNEDDVKPICLTHGFKNPFDVTKIDNSRGLPPVLRENDMFVVHLGEGHHKFVPGIARGYHGFEAVPIEQTFTWKYRRSLLNNINTSESNILSVANNQRIIHDFLYEDIMASPKSYGSNRTKIPAKYHVGEDPVDIDLVQVEIDFTLEYGGVVTFFEAKNGEPKDFNVFQLFHPLHYYLKATEEKEVKSIQACYLLRKRNRLRLYLYSFDDPSTPESIRLERNAEYTLVER